MPRALEAVLRFLTAIKASRQSRKKSRKNWRRVADQSAYHIGAESEGKLGEAWDDAGSFSIGEVLTV
jgi:hypothetical protein